MQALLMYVAVVLTLLSAIGAILIAARPKALRFFGVKTVIAAAVGVVAGVISGMLRKGFRSGRYLVRKLCGIQKYFPDCRIGVPVLANNFLVDCPWSPTEPESTFMAQSDWRDFDLGRNRDFLPDSFYYLFGLTKHLFTGN